MDKLIPIFIIIGVMILGIIMKFIELSDIVKRLTFTNNYRNRLNNLINGILSNNFFDQELYYALTSEVKSMQCELGIDGVIAYVTDPLRGVSVENYQLLVNFLPELRTASSERDNPIMVNRYIKLAQDCDDMFIRHLGTLNEIEKTTQKSMFNPFSCFSEGIKFIVSSPILLLNWFGFISDETTRKIKFSWILKFLNIICTLVGFVGGLMSIIVGWRDFWQIIYHIF